MRRLVVAILAAVALAAGAASGAEARTLWGEIASADGVRISRTDWSLRRGAPFALARCDTGALHGPSTTELPYGSTGGSWCKSTTVSDIGEDFQFTIDDGAYVVYGSVVTPFAGDNEIRCEIRRAGTSTPARDAPYVCTALFAQPDSFFDPRPRFIVARKGLNEVTDPAAQRALFKQLCLSKAAVCHFQTPRSEEKVVDDGEAVWLVGPFANCSTKKAELTFSHTVVRSTSSSFDVSVKGGVELFEFFKAEIAAKLNVEWESSREYRSTQTVPIEPGRWGGLQLVPAVDVVTGDVEIITSTAVYALRSVRIELPPRSVADGSFPGDTHVVGGAAEVRCANGLRPGARLRKVRVPLR